MERTGAFVRKLLQEKDSLSDAGNCRNSVSQIEKAVKQEFPTAQVDILVHPEAKAGLGVHYSLEVDQNGEKTLINAVPAPGFPQYIGDPENAHPVFRSMKKTTKVI
ncbi:hypothetical protein A2393_02040 [Candidatus Woesebacteria bacterium RIFOXYB1_FULL_41_13]|uniref:Uncharacterized protein n=1 Tax=Candidatus Woesebacteria bacterium RIFOXYB1_FULL_41_13 TaxID=1802540 RepID=A0A1F8CZ77_9BACT|nr:MAG: hypothetical protein A2393_02040 [Candidatus Woesebacteria bacterium RIFOXYB1_FULL_41_13]